MDLKRITGKAKDLVEKRGGSDSLKQDAEELKGIAKGQGSLADKAKAAVSAIKDPGTDQPGATAARPTPAVEASAAEAARADEKVKGEQRGKHAQGGHRGKGRGGRRRHGGGEGRHGRDDDPAV